MPAAALPPSNAPTPEYRRHHAVEAPVIDEHEFRPGWRRRTRLDQLVDAGAINIREYRAALGFRRTYEAAYRGTLAASTWDRVFVDRGCRRAAVAEMTEHQAAALTRLAEIRAALGALYVLLVSVVISDARWCELARQFGIDARTARSWGVASIAALAAV